MMILLQCIFFNMLHKVVHSTQPGLHIQVVQRREGSQICQLASLIDQANIQDPSQCG